MKLEHKVQEPISLDHLIDRPTMDGQASRMHLRRPGTGQKQLPWIATWVCLFILGLSFRSPAAEWFVDPLGSDSNPGTREKPFATLETARAAVRGFRTNLAPRESLSVWLMGGDYPRTSTFELTEADSGTPDHPIVWASAPGKSPRLLGGSALTHWHRVSDVQTLERLHPSALGHVLETDLAAQNIPFSGEMQSRGFGRPTAVAHCELFFNHRPMTLARWPNEGEFTQIAGYPDAGASRDEHGGDLGKLPDGFSYSGDRPARWKDITEVWVHGYWAWDWANSYERIASLDAARHLIRTAPPYGQYGFRKGQRFYCLNVLEELDQPGEWHLDVHTGKLRFWPPDRPSLHEAETVLSTLNGPLVRFRGASHVILRGWTLEATRASGIEILQGISNRVEGCLLRNLGNSGIVVEGGLGNAISACEVIDTGDSGVSLTGGDRQTLMPGLHRVENTHFSRQGRWSKCYVPAVLLQGVGLQARQNLIEDHPHCGILFWGNDHSMEGNEIRRVALETGDVGAIYTGRDYSFRGNRIVHNFIHDIGGVGMGSMGVYADDCVSGLHIEGNLFLRVQRAAFLGGGRDHKVLNNIFIDCKPSVEIDGRGLEAAPVWKTMVESTMRTSLESVPGTLYRQRYPEIQTLDQYYPARGLNEPKPPEFKGIPPEGNLVAGNICVGPWLNLTWHARPEWIRVENNLTNSPHPFIGPLPVDPRPCDFQVAAELLNKTGTSVPIPCAQIGLQPTEMRRWVESRLKPSLP